MSGFELVVLAVLILCIATCGVLIYMAGVKEGRRG